MSDRIAVMKDGVFQQIGTPAEIYDRPKTSYVAEFVGNANIISGVITDLQDGIAKIEAPGGIVEVNTQEEKVEIGRKVTLAIRRENISVHSAPSANGLRCRLREKSFAGGMLKMILELEDGPQVVSNKLGMNYDLNGDGELYMGFQAEHGVLVDAVG
jgi:spermidine/putrescine transport system ATP-binding protein